MLPPLKREKIGSQARLISNIIRKDRAIASRFCFLWELGVLSAGIPLSNEIIDTLRKQTFVQYHKSLNTVNRDLGDNLKEFIKRVERYVAKYEDDYNDFISTTERKFVKKIKNDEKKLKEYATVFSGEDIASNTETLLLKDNLYEFCEINF